VDHKKSTFPGGRDMRLTDVHGERSAASWPDSGCYPPSRFCGNPVPFDPNLAGPPCPNRPDRGDLPDRSSAERRRRQLVRDRAGRAICCCCCCLRTIGGLVGGLPVSRPPDPTPRYIDPDAGSPSPRRGTAHVRRARLACLWALFSFATAAAGANCLVYASSSPLGELMLGAPSGSSCCCRCSSCLHPRPDRRGLLPLSVSPDRQVALRRVGLITLWSFVGTMVGTLIMPALTRTLRG
jgi:hypothetical protein